MQNFWVVVFHNFANGGNQLCQERFVNAELLAGYHGPPKQPPDDIAPPHVRWEGTITNGKGNRPDVVGNNLKLNVVGLISPVLFASRQGRDLLDNWHEEVGFKVCWCILKDGNDPFQAHPRINVLVGERLVSIFWRVVKLAEDDVPDFQVAFVFAARVAFRVIFCQVIEFLPPVVENFGIRTRRPLTNIPEVVLIGNQVVFGNPDFPPFIVGIMVFRVVGDVETGWVKAEPVVTRQQFPGPRDDLIFKVIPNGEVAEHFKHRVVARRLPHVFNIVGPNTLLGGSHPRVIRDDLPVKVLLHRCHPRINP